MGLRWEEQKVDKEEGIVVPRMPGVSSRALSFLTDSNYTPYKPVTRNRTGE